MRTAFEMPIIPAGHPKQQMGFRLVPEMISEAAQTPEPSKEDFCWSPPQKTVVTQIFESIEDVEKIVPVLSPHFSAFHHSFVSCCGHGNKGSWLHQKYAHRRENPNRMGAD